MSGTIGYNFKWLNARTTGEHSMFRIVFKNPFVIGVLALMLPLWGWASLGPHSVPMPRTPTVAPLREGQRPIALPRVKPWLPVFLNAGSVVCPSIDVLGTYMDGHRAGGADEGHKRVEQLFRRVAGDCVRTVETVQVQVLEALVSDDKLAEVKWAGMRYLAHPDALSN
jgi:hypothetical protein